MLLYIFYTIEYISDCKKTTTSIWNAPPPKNYLLFHILLLTTLLQWAAEQQMLMSWPANTAMQSIMSTYQFFIEDPREQWMFTEVLHHPEVDFLHICDGIYQTLTQADKHTEIINTALWKILKLCYLLIWTHLSKNKHTHCTDEKVTNIYESLFFWHCQTFQTCS